MEYIFSDRVQSLKPSAIREIFKYASDPTVVSLSAGNPSPEAFPTKEIAEISQRIFQDDPISALQYSVTEGYSPLREFMTDYMKSRHNVGSELDDILITSGAQQIMDLSSKAILNEGDVVICENPSFIGSLNTFRSYNAHLVGVEFHGEGVLHHGVVLAAFAEQSSARAFVHVGFAHRDHRVDCRHEVGRGIVGQKFGAAEHQMAAGGEAHRPDRRVAFRFNGF